MDRSGYPLFSDEVPPDYQTLFQSQFTEQSIYSGQTLDANHYAEQYWVPYLGTQHTVDDPLIVSAGASHQTTTTHKDSGVLYNHAGLTPEQALNYSYYWHLLTNSTPVESNSRPDSPNVDSGSSFSTASVEFKSPENSTAQNQSSSLYSAMLKKGLNILPGLRKTNDDLQHPKPEPLRSTLNQRRNSYPNSNQNPSAVRPSVSMPLDPISLNGSRKTNKKPPKVADEAIHETFQEMCDSRLNNSVNISCSTCSKCTLNVNNDFSETADKEPVLPMGEKLDPGETQPAKRKSKPKTPQSNFQEAAPGVLNSQEPVKRSKSKTNQCKGKSRTEKGKSHRKRHSVPDTEEPPPFFNLVFQLKVLLSQVPIQPLLVSLTETVVSLLGMSVGLLWVFAILSFEWAQALFRLVQKWVLLAWHCIRAHGGGLISALFLRIPNDYYSGAADKGKSKNSTTLESNLPKTGEEAVQRLLKLKQTDPYSILGISSEATDEDIKRSYKSQAILVHPDKNHFPGAEEAFKILASAFEILGNPENRAQYDKENVLNHPLSEASQEIADFLEKLKQNIEEAQSFLGCQNCGKTHRRYRMDRTPSEARYCAACKDKHSAKEGDLWAETSMMGFKWHYYSYLDGAIYDVTEWVTCQPNLVSRVEANTHFVPCRLATPKNKNRSTAFSRMEDLKDLVNDLLNANQAAGTDTATQRSATQNGKTKAKRATGGRKKK